MGTMDPKWKVSISLMMYKIIARIEQKKKSSIFQCVYEIGEHKK